jgi:hypothetical protein
MPEITFIVDPGADDIVIDGVSLNVVDELRSECLSGGAVSCDWDTLHSRLINHDVSRMWWFIKESERRSIVEMAVNNTISYRIYRFGYGEYDCVGNINEWRTAVCVQNFVIRYALFSSMGSKQYTDLTNCYWKRSDESTDEVCFVPEHPYGLPCNAVSSHGHVMCGIQVVHGLDSLDNWIVFQYSDFDIKWGNWQMPADEGIGVREVTNLQGGGYNSVSLTGFSP